ncbi:hypothetical protein, partial [uncultured Desulfovibrio sp.]|uniref:hypothetical protein n=1 Tax=uncultured Desulfovibrio sp. TaxID=167968 RepID=UPI00262C9485
FSVKNSSFEAGGVRENFSRSSTGDTPREIFLFLARLELSYFLGFFRNQHPSVAPLQTDVISQPHCMTEPTQNTSYIRGRMEQIRAPA